MTDQGDWQWSQCNKCDGTGVVDLTEETCDACNGEGTIWEWIEE